MSQVLSLFSLVPSYFTVPSYAHPNSFQKELLSGNNLENPYRNWLHVLIVEERPLDCELVQGRHSGGVEAEQSDIRSNSHIHETVWDSHLHHTNLT